MDIVVTKFRDVVVDDVRNARDIDAATDNIGGDQQRHFSLPELRHGSGPCALGHVPVNGTDGFHAVGEESINSMGLDFRSTEDDGLLGCLPLKEFEQ